jgi:excisionase family DNA binding protein
MPDNRVISVDEAAEALGVSRNTAYEAIKKGQLPHIRVGRRIVVPKLAFERLLEQGNPPKAA